MLGVVRECWQRAARLWARCNLYQVPAHAGTVAGQALNPHPTQPKLRLPAAYPAANVALSPHCRTSCLLRLGAEEPLLSDGCRRNVIEATAKKLQGTPAEGLSRADLVALAGAHAVRITGGPQIKVGRGGWLGA